MQQKRKTVIKYVPHGIDEKKFYPILKDSEEYPALMSFKKQLFNDQEIDFVLFFNSRNIRRKSVADLILAYRLFCDRIGEEASKKCALVMHTQPVDENGTDLYAVREALCDERYINVFFSDGRLDTVQLNLLYNVCDANILISSNEGWGLSLTEAMMAGKMIIANVTGGMQDQMRFEDEEGNWIDFTDEFPSNHRGTYKTHGEWAVPVFPSNISIAGSVQTPYIYDDRCSPEEVSDAILKVYNLPKEERERKGLLGREWVTGEESKMSAKSMCENVISSIDKSFEQFKPRTNYEVYKIEDRPKKYIMHKLVY